MRTQKGREKNVDQRLSLSLDFEKYYVKEWSCMDVPTFIHNSMIYMDDCIDDKNGSENEKIIKYNTTWG